MPIMTELITLTGSILARSKDAILWKPRSGNRQLWIPKSCVIKEVKNFSGYDQIVITEWFARKNGLKP